MQEAIESVLPALTVFFSLVFTLFVVALAVGGLALTWFSIREGERRAAWIGGFLFTTGGFLAAIAVNGNLQGVLTNGGMLPGNGSLALPGLAVLLGAILILRPWNLKPPVSRGTLDYLTGPVRRFDQRDVVLTRTRLTPGTPTYQDYYLRHPEREQRDAVTRAMKPPTGKAGSIDAGNPFNVAMHEALSRFPIKMSLMAEAAGPGTAGAHAPVAAAASGGTVPNPVSSPEGPPIEALVALDGGVRARGGPAHQGLSSTPLVLDPVELTLRVKGFARYLGADLVGITGLRKEWIYSHAGEIHTQYTEEWGKPITLDHSHAIVIATRMRDEMVVSRPHTPMYTEVMRNYSLVTWITHQMVSFLNNLGYEARAHHWRNYQVLCVPLAVDAGLGELGRNGYLLTGKYGLKVRLAAVTVTAPLLTDRPISFGVQDFCGRCSRCARLCPAGSIPAGDKVIHNHVRKWKLDEQSCLEYWCRVGTSCGICMAVCPWSHPDSPPHRLARFFARRSPAGRRTLTRLEEFMYGRNPKPRAGNRWSDYRPYRPPVSSQAGAIHKSTETTET